MTHTIRCFSLSLVALLGLSVISEISAADTVGVQPGFFVARMADEENIEFEWYTERTIVVTKTADVEFTRDEPVYLRNEAGQLTLEIASQTNTRQVMYNEEQMLRESHTREVSIEMLTAFDTEGNEIPRAELAKQLNAAQAVVVSHNRNIVDPFYLGILRDDTVVFVSRDPTFPVNPVSPFGYHNVNFIEEPSSGDASEGEVPVAVPNESISAVTR